MKILKIGLILSCFALFVFACNQASNNINSNISQSNTNARVNANTLANTNALANSGNTGATPADEMAAAKTLYLNSCAKCHKEDGTGGISEVEGKKIKAVNFASPGMKKESDEDLFAEIRDGVENEGMPAFKGRLSDEQIKSLVKFIRKEFQSK